MILCDLCWEFTWCQVLQSYSVCVRVRVRVRVRFAEEGADRHLARQRACHRGVGFFQLLQGKKWTIRNWACMHACLIAQSRLTICNSTDYSPPSSSVHGISRQEYWSELLCPPPGDLSNSGIKPTSPVSPAWQADSLPGEPSEPYRIIKYVKSAIEKTNASLDTTCWQCKNCIFFTNIQNQTKESSINKSEWSMQTPGEDNSHTPQQELRS